jgi:hypothetical protein
MKDAVQQTSGPYIDSLAKADEYKRQAIVRGLRIQKLADARADPPRGFWQPGALFHGECDLESSFVGS